MTDLTEVEKLLAELPTIRPPAGWKERIRASIAAGTPPKSVEAPATRRPLWVVGSTLVAAAAAIVLYFAIGNSISGASSPSVTVQVKRSTSHQVATRDRTAAGVGDTIVFEARGAALRVYRDGAQIARCPGHTGCARSSDGFVFALEVSASGSFSAIAYTPGLPDPQLDWQPSARDLDTDIASAIRMQIEMTPPALIDVP